MRKRLPGEWLFRLPRVELLTRRADCPLYTLKPAHSSRLLPPAQVVPELTRHYWRGIVDGDGYISKDGDRLTLVGDYEVILQFQMFALAQCSEMKACISRKENIYQIQLRGKVARKILEVLYADATVFLERKYELAR